MIPAEQRIGCKFGRLVIKRVIHRTGGTVAVALCECGVIHRGKIYTIIDGRTRSCGCLSREAKRNFKHGDTGVGFQTTEYRTWANMLCRCYNKNIPNYKDYGFRGVTVCERWRNSYQNFLVDMGRKPTVKHTIERIDTNGNYELSNCRWATPSEQGQNKRKRHGLTSKFIGVCRKLKNKKRWYAKIGANRKQLYLGTFLKEEDAALAYDIAAKKYYGKFANLNFPERP